MNKDLQKVALRYQAVYVANTNEEIATAITEPAANFVANLAKLGFTVEEKLLHQLNRMNPAELLGIYENFVETMQLRKNWMPLVKGWDIPTEEKRVFHILTWIANIMPGANGTKLECGHLIPEGTFPLDRYNGCPFCGQPFTTSSKLDMGKGSKLKLLRLWGKKELAEAFENLLLSKTSLDATQSDSLRLLLPLLPLPEVEIQMKETQVLVIDHLKNTGKAEQAGKYFKTPVDIMRYLWFKHTGMLQIVEPSVLIRMAGKNQTMLFGDPGKKEAALREKKESLRLKYGRTESRMIAQWLNDLPLSAEKAAELMHPKRAMWVRFIRALRLAEYSKLPGMEKLRELMDIFYNEEYAVAAGEIEEGRMKYDAEATFSQLKQRPGLFARSLFANMLWFGSDTTLKEFNVVINNVPSRLLVTLASYANDYFDESNKRTVKTISGVAKSIGANKFLSLYTPEVLAKMVDDVETVCLAEIERRFAQQNNSGKRIYIEPGLNYMPVPIGDRSQTVQDVAAALMGTRFPVAGNRVRLFMQWGEGLKKQSLDMDLSCVIAYDNRIVECAFFNLFPHGAKHSGDIRQIPNYVGTAEYIDLDIDILAETGARYVSFACNAYSDGSITPNLVVGWMNSENPMTISPATGVAYDPSCVQHMIRVTRGLAKGLVFGVLDIKTREITWLEIPFGGATVKNLNAATVEGLLRKLNTKMSVGRLLAVKAKAQAMETVADPALADEVYDSKWAQDAAAITKLLID